MDEETNLENMATEEAVQPNKHEKFLEACQTKVQKAAKAIVAISGCSNKRSFEYSQEEVANAFAYLQNILDDTKSKFSDTSEQTFSWDTSFTKEEE